MERIKERKIYKRKELRQKFEEYYYRFEKVDNNFIFEVRKGNMRSSLIYIHEDDLKFLYELITEYYRDESQ